MAQQARDYSKGTFLPAIDTAGGTQYGNVMVPATAASDGNPTAVLPSGTAPELQAFAGACISQGFVGGTGTAAGDEIALKRLGAGVLLLETSTAAPLSSDLIASAGTFGCVKPRTPYSSSAVIIATTEEALGSVAAPQKIEAMIIPHKVEIVRQISTFTGTIGNVTKYANGIGGAISTNFVPLYLCRFTGETIRNLAIDLGTAPGGADTVAVTVYKAAGYSTTGSATALTCTATAAAKVASDLTHAVALTAGDVLGVYVASSNVTAANLAVTFDVT